MVMKKDTSALKKKSLSFARPQELEISEFWE